MLFVKATRPALGPVTVNPRWRIGIVAARYHADLVDRLVEGAVQTLTGAGIPASNITVYPVAGTFEIPLLGAALARGKRVDALIGLGIVLTGETAHADTIAREAARGIMDVQVQLGIPFAFEIIQVTDLAQAEARCGGKVNRGEDAARAVLHSLAQLAKVVP